MELRKFAAMISTANDYSILKWPSLFISFSIMLLALMLLLSFHSNSWYSYESIGTRSIRRQFNKTTQYSDLLEYGSFGLWSICVNKLHDPITKCDTWIQETRPEYFTVIIILSTFTLYLAHLAIFPSWALLILILYNTNNRYLRSINVVIWIVLLFSLLVTTVLGSILIINSLTKFHTPGRFILDRMYVSFHASDGISFLIVATTLASVCLVSTIITLVWKTFIEMKIIQLEGELFKQLSDENFQPVWNKPIMIPRTTSTLADNHEEPPPYNYFYEQDQ
ncbi:unnamed protein product [Rotaria sp. Silwood2]|nr:unnamed protein product [Rotaria sp. Silwood2]